jgi:tRNA/tmRNA/rRNA uracil-C5-methylase (TrmA/RlmC/RlmD family)
MPVAILHVRVHTGDVAKILPRFSAADVIVLDPPREGAGKDVIDQMVALRPQRIVYVACDPAALARDTAFLQSSGFQLRLLRAFDLFPMTHHIECVALFVIDKVS